LKRKTKIHKIKRKGKNQRQKDKKVKREKKVDLIARTSLSRYKFMICVRIKICLFRKIFNLLRVAGLMSLDGGGGGEVVLLGTTRQST
jgi:hypothetical protein